MLNVAWLSFVVANAVSARPLSPEVPERVGVWVAQAEPDDGPPPQRSLPPQGRDVIRRPPPVPRRPVSPEQVAPPTPLPPAVGQVPPPQQPAARPVPPPGTSVAPPPANAPAAGGEAIDFEERARRGKFSFDFSKAEIVDVVKAISDITRRNFIIPESIKGQRITILSPTKITAAEAYQVFLAALEVNGISIVRSGKFYKLIQAKDATKEPIPTCIGPDDDGCPKYSEQMITIILPLKHVDAQQLNPVVRSLMSKEAELQVFPPTNALIMSEFAHNLTRVRRIIDALDVPGFEDELQIVQIQYATATEIADKLTQIFDVRGGVAPRPGIPGRPPAPMPAPGMPGGPPGPDDAADVQISKIVADDRTNQLIIKANRRSFDAIRRLIAKLDIPISMEEAGRVHVYYLENASAEDLASTLSSLAQGQPNRGQRPGRTGTPDVPGQPRPPGQVESASLFEGEVKITADKATNSLIIVGSGRDYRALSRIIEQLDTPRRQVYVEAAILEVTVGNDQSFGLNYHFPGRFKEGQLPGGAGGTGTIGFLQSISGFATPEQLLQVGAGTVAGIFGKPLSLSVGDKTVSIPSFGIILKLLETSSNARILSTPHILTTDNEEASIEVGQKIPFFRGTAVPSIGNVGGGTGINQQQVSSALSGFNNFFSSVDRIDVSLKLTLTPQINERGKIRLEIDQQVEDIVGEVQASATPTTANRSTQTVIVVDDQQTVVIGGLMRDRTTDSETKIPVLGDLPLLGWLFKSRSHKIEKVNLLLVLTPYIIREANDFQGIFERKLREYEEFAAEYYGDSREYRAYIDYTRKSGPFARMVQTLRRERTRAENGGEGGESEIIIRPRGGAAPNETVPRDERQPAGRGEVTPPAGAATDPAAPVEPGIPVGPPDGTTPAPLPENPMAPEVAPVEPAPDPASPPVPEGGPVEPPPAYAPQP